MDFSAVVHRLQNFKTLLNDREPRRIRRVRLAGVRKMLQHSSNASTFSGGTCLALPCPVSGAVNGMVKAGNKILGEPP